LLRFRLRVSDTGIICQQTKSPVLVTVPFMTGFLSDMNLDFTDTKFISEVKKRPKAYNIMIYYYYLDCIYFLLTKQIVGF
jgi:hypothetical protein